jgi:hypothetical protein
MRDDICLKKPDKVWNESPLHSAIEKNKFTLLAFLTLMGGHWNSKNEEKKSALRCFINKIEIDGQTLAKSHFLIRWWLLQATDNFGQHLLHHAAWTNNIK